MQQTSESADATQGKSKYNWGSYTPRSYDGVEGVDLSNLSCTSCVAEVTGADNYAANYIKPGSMNLTVSRDIFLYSTVTKSARPKSSSSGIHTSSSGRTHGGRGGSF